MGTFESRLTRNYNAANLVFCPEANNVADRHNKSNKGKMIKMMFFHGDFILGRCN